ncbi:MAG: hypothetical protein NZZ41_07725 [Candidatus Dojkabacteria bacterium]|nr:hypothetical protein [Candidatus Dojkabacteria bacterium]
MEKILVKKVKYYAKLMIKLKKPKEKINVNSIPLEEKMEFLKKFVYLVDSFVFTFDETHPLYKTFIKIVLNNGVKDLGRLAIEKFHEFLKFDDIPLRFYYEGKIFNEIFPYQNININFFNNNNNNNNNNRRNKNKKKKKK